MAQEKKDSVINFKKEIIIKENKFRVYNNWISGGIGASQNFGYGYSNHNFILDFNFHRQEKYFNLGVLLVGDDIGNYYLFQFHGGIGKRIENQQWNFAGFVGPSYSKGYKKKNGYYVDEMYSEFGAFISIEAIKKITYDIGIGIKPYADFNFRQTVAGASVVLYFSSAYQGKYR